MTFMLTNDACSKMPWHVKDSWQWPLIKQSRMDCPEKFKCLGKKLKVGGAQVDSQKEVWIAQKKFKVLTIELCKQYCIEL